MKGKSITSRLQGIAITTSILVIAVLILGGSFQLSHASSAVKITEGHEWSYFKGTQEPAKNWKENGFDGSSWQKGLSGFGYGPLNNRTYLGDMQGMYSTVYARSEFAISSIYSITDMTISIVCDGSFVAYLNGVEIIRNDSGMPYQINETTGKPQSEALNIKGFMHELMPGNNLFSVECSNNDINSGSFAFVPSLEITEDKGGDIQ